MPPTPLVRRRWATTRGQSLVEFALVLPILLIMLLGLLDFGRAVVAYNAVSNGARSAARVAIVDQNVGEITAAAEAEAHGLPEINVQFNGNPEGVAGCPQTIGCLIEVTVSTDYMPATPIINTLVGSFTVSSTSRMPVERPSSP